LIIILCLSIGFFVRLIDSMGYFYVETKAFKIRSNVQGGVQLAEKSRGRTRLVIMAWPTIFWLASAWDYLTNNEIVGENWRTFRFGCYSYIVQRRKNSFGNFLELSEYGDKGRRSYMIIPSSFFLFSQFKVQLLLFIYSFLWSFLF
jgi:hypothetical protein